MNDQQLYLAIGVPILFNFAMMTLGFSLLTNHFNKRIDDLRAEMIARFEHLDKLWDAKLARMEGIVDARLRHLEENR